MDVWVWACYNEREMTNRKALEALDNNVRTAAAGAIDALRALRAAFDALDAAQEAAEVEDVEDLTDEEVSAIDAHIRAIAATERWENHTIGALAAMEAAAKTK